MTVARALRPLPARRGSHPARSAQRGAALLTAMIIVTLVATLAASMVWQQWRAVQVEGAERARAQSGWILAGALDWARLILKEDARSGANPVDHLGEPWAVPLAEARLSTFLAVDQSNTDDAPDAFLSGLITDAQSRFNVTNLLKPDGTPDEDQLLVLTRLCVATGISSDAATRLMTGLVAIKASAKTPSATTPLTPRTVPQLAWLGIPADALKALSPYLVVLDTATPINMNTAPREVVFAAVKGFDLGQAERFVQTRSKKHFDSTAALQAALPPNFDMAKVKLSVNSSFFEVRGRLRLGTRVLEQISLVERRRAGTMPDVIVLHRERVSGLDQPAS
jgi:general secretion pathway protein K